MPAACHEQGAGSQGAASTRGHPCASTCPAQALAAACFCSDAEMPRAKQSWLRPPRVAAPSAAPCPAKVSSRSCLWLGPAHGSPGLCHGSCFCPTRHGEQLPSTAVAAGSVPHLGTPQKRDPRCQQPPAPQLLGLGSARLHPPGAQHGTHPGRWHQEQPQEDVRECERSLGWSAAGTLSRIWPAFNTWQNSKIPSRKQGLNLTRAASLGRKLS